MRDSPAELDDLETLVATSWQQALDGGRQGVVGCLITRPGRRCFVQKRALSRRLFPGCWDLIGGHVEPGELPFEALAREITEETGWTLASVDALLQVVDWESVNSQGRVELKREWVFVVTVHGDLEHPALEAQKVTEGRWIGESDLPLLAENRTGGDDYVARMARQFFETQQRTFP